MRKWISLPVSVILDDRLSDSELHLLLKLTVKVGNGKFTLNDYILTELAMSERTFYRLSKNLIECQYLQHVQGVSEYCVSLSCLTVNGDKVDSVDCQSCRSENEEERSKEEDKEHSQTDSSYIINNNIRENEKEREIQKRENDGPEAEKADRFTAEYREIIDYLNEKTGKKFSARSRVNQGHMSARLKEGFTVEDFKRVIDVKYFQWHDDPKMAKFLRPETLFGTKFDRYFNEEKFVMREGLHGEKYVVTEEEMNSDCPF